MASTIAIRAPDAGLTAIAVPDHLLQQRHATRCRPAR
jgi:hypothetical protein